MKPASDGEGGAPVSLVATRQQDELIHTLSTSRLAVCRENIICRARLLFFPSRYTSLALLI
jgi:hypothetical protein